MFIRLPEDFVVPIVYKDNFKFNDTNIVKESIRSLEYISNNNTNNKYVKKNNIPRNNYWQEIDDEYVYNSLSKNKNIKDIIKSTSNRLDNKSCFNIFQHIDEDYINGYVKE